MSSFPEPYSLATVPTSNGTSFFGFPTFKIGGVCAPPKMVPHTGDPNRTPLPNSRWLHHTALSYMGRAQLGACMWCKVLNWAKLGPKWAKNICLSIPNGPGSLLEKRVFDPVLTHFWSKNGPFSRDFGIFHGPKRVTSGSKWAKNTCLTIPYGPRSLLEKCLFDPFDAFVVLKRPIFKAFWHFPWPKTRHHGLKMG